MGLRAAYGVGMGLAITLAACATGSPATEKSRKEQAQNTKTQADKSGQLAPIKLVEGDCGLFVWTGQDRRFTFFSQGRDRIRLAKDGREVFLRPEGKQGLPDIFGQYPTGNFIDAAGQPYALSFSKVDTLGESVRYSGGSFRSQNEAGWERIETAFGLSTCMPGEEFPIERTLSASRFDLIRPIGGHNKEPPPTVKITMTPVSLQRQTEKVLSVPAVTKLAKPRPEILPDPPATQISEPQKPEPQEASEGLKLVTVSGDYYVQIASYLSESRAEQAWKKLQENNSSLRSFEPQIIPAQIPEKGLYFRLQIGGFEGRSDAAQNCQSLKDRGLDCFVMRRN